jgi:tyrosyl-tRNA synthetase
VLIIGDFTARVGDPSGRSELRPMLSPEQIEANARTYQEQAFKVLDPDRTRLELRRNSEWLDMTMGDLFALVRTATVGQLMQRDDFAKRAARSEPVSVLELLYPLMQGYDSVAVRADVELGGTDQTFNLLLGRDVQRAYGQPEQAVLTMPLLVGVDGVEKMSKSLGNHIGVTDPPREIYGRTMSIPDSALAQWYQLLLGRELPAGADPLAAKRVLARDLTAIYASPAAADREAAEWDSVQVARGQPSEIPEAVFYANGGVVHLPALIAEIFGGSRSDARRLITQGGVSAIVSCSPGGRPWRLPRVLRRASPGDEARRSLKTQQHAHRGPAPAGLVCVQVRPAVGRVRASPAAARVKNPQYPCHGREPCV